MITEVREAVYTKGNAISGLTGGFHHIQAQPKNSYPYSVFSRPNGIPERDSVNEFQDEYVQMNHYHTDAAELETIAKAFQDAFDNQQASLIMDSYWCIDITMQFERGPTKLDDVWQITQQYKIHIQKK